MNGETNVVPYTPGADRALEKELKAFNGGLPYNRDRVIERTQGAIKAGVMAYFEAGCGMILLYENDRHTYAGILEQYFPGVSERTARNWRNFARQMAAHPQFRAFVAERGGYSIALTVLEGVSAEDLQEFEETGLLKGYTREQISKMSVRTLQKALAAAKVKEAKAVMAATEKVGKENLALLERVEELEAALAPPGVRAAYEVVHKAQGKFMQVTQLLGKIPRKLIDQDQGLQNLILAACDGFQRVIGELAEYAMDSLAQFEAKRRGD